MRDMGRKWKQGSIALVVLGLAFCGAEVRAEEPSHSAGGHPFEMQIYGQYFVFHTAANANEHLYSFNRDAQDPNRPKIINGEHVSTFKIDGLPVLTLKTMIDGVITSCDTLIYYKAGMDDASPSYGGFCSLTSHDAEKDKDKENSVMVCNDETGHFSLQFINRDEMTRDELAVFIISDCYGS